MAFSLWPYQADDTQSVRQLLRQHRSVLYQLPTGGGKTVTAGNIIQRSAARGFKSLVLVHRKELVRQFVKTLGFAGLDQDVGVISPHFTPTPWAPIQIASVFSLARRHITFQPDLIFIDEAHHIRAKTWETVLERYPDAKLIGLTATPSRLDGKGLGHHFEVMHCGPSIRWLVDNKYLAPTWVQRVPIGFSRKGVRKTAGDYNRGQLDQRANEAVVGNSVKAYLEYVEGLRTVMFGVSKRHAWETAQRLQNFGVRAAYIGDDTPAKERDYLVQAFDGGDVHVLCNVSLIDEGFDVKGCECVMDVAHTTSTVRAMQRWGRAMRYLPGKTARLLDLVGNTYMLGLPDVHRHWSLGVDEPNGAPLESEPKPAQLRCCKECLTVFPPRLGSCPNCGAMHDGRPVSEVDVELIEASPTKPKTEPKPGPKMTRQERGQLLYETRVLHEEGKSVEAWQRLSQAASNVGYDPNWAHILADHIGISEDARRA